MDLKTLCELPGPSGNEKAVRSHLAQEAKKICDDVRIDRMGNVVCRKKSGSESAPHIVMAAHMDEVGFIVVGHSDDGMLLFRSIGGIDPRAIVSKWVKIGDVPGVIGAKAIHLQSKEDRERVLKYENLYIDIGAKEKTEAEKLCPVGAYAVFDAGFETFGDGFVVSKALDDRVGCYTLLRLMQNDYACDVSYVFTTGEEVGLRGATGAGYLLQPDIAVILEGTAANDLGDTKERFHVVTPGKGVAVSFMDGSSIADKELYKQMLDLAAAGGIPCQVTRGVTGGNAAGMFQRGAAGARTVVLSVPCRYIHSGSGVAKLNDIQAQYSLADAFLKQY